MLGWRWDLLLDWGIFSLQPLPQILWIFAEWWTLDAGIFIVGESHSLASSFLSPYKDRFKKFENILNFCILGTLNEVDRRLTCQMILCFILHFLSMVRLLKVLTNYS